MINIIELTCITTPSMLFISNRNILFAINR
ncbi:hypothetical protein CLSAP_13480 [Clostridium saccharoperbutylacetonicum]|nr:hypothetical protein CLSAP_13480 [Clostridium saccharoperbutylacetonicum]NSB29740.1 hypothetical protein [Clostridium saccharoperbutylacetonicum]